METFLCNVLMALLIYQNLYQNMMPVSGIVSSVFMVILYEFIYCFGGTFSQGWLRQDVDKMLFFPMIGIGSFYCMTESG